MNNSHRANSKLAIPHKDPDEVFVELFERRKQVLLQGAQETQESYTLESLVVLASRRMLRQHLSRRWHDVSWVSLASFIPKKPSDLLLWRCTEGLESSRWPQQTQSWRSLLQQSRKQETKRLPKILVVRPDFALMFFLVYPHRISVPLVKMLDAWMPK